MRRCTGEFACPYQRNRAPQHFVSRRAFDIEGLGEKQMPFFFEKGLIREPADIFTLQARDERADNLQRIRNFDGSARPPRQSLRAIAARRAISLERLLIFALGIRHVGETTARMLARAYGSWGAFEAAALKVAAGDAEAPLTWMRSTRIGETVIEAVAKYFGEEHNRAVRRPAGGPTLHP